MTRRAIAAALGAMRHLSIAWLLWLVNAGLAAAIIPATWIWWRRTADLPEADPLLGRFRIGVFLELARADDGRGLATIAAIAAAVLVAGMAASAFTSGGVLHRLLHPKADSAAGGFFRGAGHFWWRFLRLSLVGGLVAAGAGIATLGLTYLGMTPVRATGAWMVAVIVEVGAPALVLAFFFAALDCARVLIAVGDDRRVLRAWFSGLLFVVRHPVVIGGLAMTIAFLWLLLAAIYLGAARMVSASAMSAIVATIVIQQLFILLRGALRVGWLAGLVTIVGDEPPAVAVAIAAPVEIPSPPTLTTPEDEGFPVV